MNSDSVKIRLGSELSDLLRDILRRRRSDLIGRIDGENIRLMSRREAREIQEILGDELIESGFQEDWEPNRKGLMLEDIIDKLNRYVWSDEGESK